MARLRVLLRAHGVELDGIYFCPHRPEAGCRCRKPEPGLLELAADDARVAPRRSVMIGDKLLDAACGQAVGAKGILVRSGHGRDEEHRIGVASAAGSPGVVPDAVCEDLAGAVAWVLLSTGNPD
jgi:D-glycero-D-manno-heptose 1,7-bisphosphate phosphatase